jgi:hypothetical protein
MLKVISLGLGVQSSYLYIASSLGIIERCDVAIFSDTGAELPETLEYLQYLLTWKEENNGIDILVMNEKSIIEDIKSNKNRFTSMPLFTLNEKGEIGMLRRQCTSEYKIAEVNKGIRVFLGLEPRKRFPKVEVYLGISFDEFERIANPPNKWRTNVYPFIGYKTTKGNSNRIESEILTRHQILKKLETMGILEPTKSACYICPFRTDYSWSLMKKNDPTTFAKAVEVDNIVRNSTKKGVKYPVFIHASCKPLEELDFDALVKEKPNLFDGIQTCESGYCGA